MNKNTCIFLSVLFLMLLICASSNHAQDYYYNWSPFNYYGFIPYYEPIPPVTPQRSAQIGTTTLLLLSALATPTTTSTAFPTLFPTVAPTIFPTITPTILPTTVPTLGSLTTLLALGGINTNTLLLLGLL